MKVATESIKKEEMIYYKSGRTEQMLFMLTDQSLQIVYSEPVKAALTPAFYLLETPRILALQQVLLEPVTCHVWKRHHTQIALSHNNRKVHVYKKNGSQ